MASSDMTEDVTEANEAPPSGPTSLTAREKRRRILTLVLLLGVLAALAAVSYSFYQSRQVPVPRLGQEGGAIAPPEFLFAITGAGANQLDRPVGLDIGPDGRVYVVDFGKRRVSIFTSDGEFLKAFSAIDEGNLRNPVHLQIKGNEVWVTDRRLKGIYIFDLEGKFSRKFEPKNEKLEWTPLALAFDSKGAPRVTDVGDSLKHRLLYFSEDGSRTVSLGKTKQVDQAQVEPGAFYFPNGVAVAKDGRVFVADGDNRRIQVFDDKGEFKRFINTSGVPRGLVIDASSRLYVVDALAHTVDLYSLDGEQLVSFGTRGFGPGQFNFPNDIALGSGGRIYITDRENHQVQVWAWPQLVVPSNVVPGEPWQVALCFMPLLLLPPLWFFRRRTYVVTPSLLITLDAQGRLDLLGKRRLRFIAPEAERASFVALQQDGIDVIGQDERHELVQFEEHSASDVAALRDRLRCTEAQAIYLTMSERSRALLTEDVELRRLGMASQIRVFDTDEFLKDIGEYREA